MTSFEPDPKTALILKPVYPDIRRRVLLAYSDMRRITGYAMKTTRGLATWAEQDRIFAQGRTAPGRIVTQAKGGESLHNFACAVDSAFFGPDPYLTLHPRGEQLWNEFGRICRTHGLKWGGDWAKLTDRPHIQDTYGLALAEIQELYKTGGLTAVFRAFDEKRGVPSELQVDNVWVMGSVT